jgi:thioredoxin-related protein
MREETLGDETIENIIKKEFIFVDIGINDTGSVIHRNFNGSKHGYAKSLEIGFYPTVGFVDSNNSIVYGAIGYQDIKSFTVLLEYIYGRHYKTMDLEDFTNNVDFESEDQ